jgi:hypothetical protein
MQLVPMLCCSNARARKEMQLVPMLCCSCQLIVECPFNVELTVMAKVMGSSVCSYLGFLILFGW